MRSSCNCTREARSTTRFTSRCSTLADVAQLQHAAAVGAAHGGAAHADHRRFHRDAGRRFRLAQRRQDGFRHRLLVGDPALRPALRFGTAARPRSACGRSSRTQITSASGGCPRRVLLRKSVLLPWAFLFLCRNAVVQPQIEHFHVRRSLADLRIVTAENSGSARRNCRRPDQLHRAASTCATIRILSGSAAFTSETSFAR